MKSFQVGFLSYRTPFMISFDPWKFVVGLFSAYKQRFYLNASFQGTLALYNNFFNENKSIDVGVKLDWNCMEPEHTLLHTSYSMKVICHLTIFIS